MMQIMFTVYGEPVAKGRPRFAKRGNYVQTYTPVKTKSYEDEVRLLATKAKGSGSTLEGSVSVFIYISFSVPQSYTKRKREACLSGETKHTKKPDLDNVAKAIIDGMNGIIFKDDSQIINLHVTKVYAEVGKVEVLIREENESTLQSN
jgi:Holliday junction resolvase RusA-like endonuclease